MSDIVQEITNHLSQYEALPVTTMDHVLLAHARDTITTLRADNERLRAALERLRNTSEAAKENRDSLLKAMIEKDAEIDRLRAEVASQVQWVKDLADNLIAEEAKTATLRAEIERLRAGNRDLQLWFDDLKIEYDKLRAALEKIAKQPRGGLMDTPEKLERDEMIGIARAALAEEKPND